MKTQRLAVILSTVCLIGGAASRLDVVHGQEEKKPAKSERRLDIKRSQLIARDDLPELPVSPVEEDNYPGASAASPRSINRPDIHGETSVENFQGTQNNLSYTHDSADGFKQFLNQWHASNFHYGDAGVGSWLFQDNASSNFDIWSPPGGIDYGIDAVRVAWHSSHGRMFGPNFFCTSLGTNWNKTGWTACSSQMELGGNYNSYGDERLRYMFWDSCQSVKISGGSTPYNTWAPRSKGVRFVFGYETDSIDNANYGKFFWEEWSKGKTFKMAFLDASWRISTGQAPMLIAFGATPAEAASRRNTETLLSPDWVSNGYGAWSWYNAHSVSKASVAQALAAQSVPGKVDIVNRGNSNQEVSEIAQSFGIQLPDENAIKSRPAGIKMVRTDAIDLVVEKNGNFELTFKNEREENAGGEALADETLIAQAEELAGQLSFINGQTLRAGMIRNLNDNTGSEGVQGEAQVTEKTIVLDQTIGDTPFIDPEAGHLEITFNARTGQLKRVRNTLKAVTVGKIEDPPASAQPVSLEEARQSALAAFGQAAGGNTALLSSSAVVAGSEAVGYQVIDGRAVLVYRAQISSSAMPGMRPYQAIVPLSK